MISRDSVSYHTLLTVLTKFWPPKLLLGLLL